MDISNEELEVLNRAGEILSKFAAQGGLSQIDLDRYEKMITSIIDAYGEKANGEEITTNNSSLFYCGDGDDVVNLQGLPQPHVFEIYGNTDKRYFGVIAYNQNARRLDAIVNTTDVYHGIVFLRVQSESTLEIKSQGRWEIKVLPFSDLRNVKKGTSISGNGDCVFLFSPENGNAGIAHITGNYSNKYFGVIGYNKNLDRIDAFVNTTEKYDGKVLLRGNPQVFEIKATGPWTIQFV